MSFDKLIYEASASFFYGLMSFGERFIITVRIILVPAFWRLEVTRWGLGMVPLVSLKEVLNENYLR